MRNKIKLKQITRPEDVVGKQIIKIGSDNLPEKVSFVFSDNTFCILKQMGSESGWIEIDDGNYREEPEYEHTADEFFKLGLLTQSERDDLIQRIEHEEKEKKIAKKLRTKEDEIALLKKLQEKYPDIK